MGARPEWQQGVELLPVGWVGEGEPSLLPASQPSSAWPRHRRDGEQQPWQG